MRKHHRVMGCEHLELVRRRDEGQAGDARDFLGDLLGKTDRCVEAVPTAVPPWASW